MDLKEQHKDCLLFYRLGDFYEMFFEDAQLASRELELVLTGRDCGLTERAPMCGVPYHSVDTYITRLIAKGHKVAICEQVEDPALAKGLVARAVVRVITPGTVIEERMLDSSKNNYLMSVCLVEKGFGFACADVSTGEFVVGELTEDQSAGLLFDEVARISPTQILADERLFAQEFIKNKLSSAYYLEKVPDAYFELVGAKARLQRHFAVANLSCFGCADKPLSLRAAGALLLYLENTQKNALSHIRAMRTVNRSAYMQLDEVTRRNLELTQPLRHAGDKKSTLYYLLNDTETAMGSRKLRAWLESPLQNAEAITARLAAVDNLHADAIKRVRFKEQLHGMYDMERLCSKIVYGTVNGRDCLALAQSLKRLHPIKALLTDVSSENLRRIENGLDTMDDIVALLDDAICPDAPAALKDGGVIRDGYDAQVDELRNIGKTSREWLARIEAAEREGTGIRNLRIGYNRVFGYYIEVSKSNVAQVPYYYERKQTLANGERYITPELKEVEERVLSAADLLLARETQLFAHVREVLSGCTDRLQENAQLLAELDVYQSFASVAAVNRYVWPEITEGDEISIVEGRHPVVEKSSKDGFIPNDVTLNKGGDRLLIITGPNMAGKSTYMRQAALITLMAHIGSFVPAKEARICIVDRIFTRIGASDDLFGGQSTFMVEMSETANIIHNATARSLLLLDEIGRGTSTFDGLSIAWAVLEHVAGLGCKTLFATHFHELSELEGTVEGVKNFRILVKEVGEDILFLRKIVRGSGDKSFGIQVARLAGVPDTVITRAKELLAELERADILNQEAPARTEVTEGTTYRNALLAELKALDLNSLTPMQAMQKLLDYQEILTARGEANG